MSEYHNDPTYGRDENQLLSPLDRCHVCDEQYADRIDPDTGLPIHNDCGCSVGCGTEPAIDVRPQERLNRAIERLADARQIMAFASDGVRRGYPQYIGEIYDTLARVDRARFFKAGWDRKVRSC